MMWKIWKKPKLNSEKIWKIQKKILKRYEKYGRKVGWSFHFSTYFSSIFSISFHISTYFSSISFHISTYFSSIFFISFYNFFLYFSNHFTIQLTYYKSDRPYVNIWGQLKDFEISKYKRESKWRMPLRIFVLFLLIVVLYVFLNIKSVKI
jgi:hypothetical protein